MNDEFNKGYFNSGASSEEARRGRDARIADERRAQQARDEAARRQQEQFYRDYQDTFRRHQGAIWRDVRNGQSQRSADSPPLTLSGCIQGGAWAAGLLGGAYGLMDFPMGAALLRWMLTCVACGALAGAAWFLVVLVLRAAVSVLAWALKVAFWVVLLALALYGFGLMPGQ